MAGISIGVASETRAFKQGIETGVIKPVEDAVDALDDLGKSKGPDKLEAGLKDAQKATDKLKDETKDTARAIEQEFRDSYGKLKSSSSDGIGKAKEGLDELKNESHSTAREAAASFSGSADDIGSAIQEVTANAFAGFGPAGAVAGLAAAAGIGVVLTAINDQQEAVDALKEKFADAYKEAAEDGRDYLDVAQIQSAAIDLMFGDAGKKTKLEAKLLGVDLSTMARALAGDEEAINVALQAGIDKRQEINDKAGDSVGTTLVEQGAVQGVVDKLNAQLQIQHDNAEAARNAIGITNDLTNAHDAVAQSVQRIGDNINRLPTGKAIPITAETTAFDAAIERIRRQKISMGIDVVVNERRGKQVL